MIVNHFNTFLRGGAATAARRLHRGLRRNGVASRFHHAAGQAAANLGAAPPDHDRETDDRRGYVETRWRHGDLLQRIGDRLRFRVHRRAFRRAVPRHRAGAEIFTSPRGKPRTDWPPIDVAEAAEANDAHVIHLHWIAKLIDWSSFFGSLPRDQPVVWTLHDMNPISGGCHFSGGCQRFRSGCGHCPQLRTPAGGDLSAANFAIKRHALRGINLHVVAPSGWLLDLAKASPIFAQARSFTRIPYGVPAERFYPVDRQAARSRLGIASDRFVICFGAMDLANRRKGSRHLIAALAAVASVPRVTCLVFGSGSIEPVGMPSDAVVHMGPVRDEATLRSVYAAADVFVLPSTEDNLPLTGLEAMACGTPVVGFDAGGIPDYVLPERTGLLAETGNAEQLGQRLLDAARHPEAMRRMGASARQRILDEFDAEIEARRYVRLYQQLVTTMHRGQRAA